MRKEEAKVCRRIFDTKFERIGTIAYINPNDIGGCDVEFDNGEYTWMGYKDIERLEKWNMKANNFQIGDFVLINGKPHKIEMITKKKVGYHLEENECHIHYAKIFDVEPIPITIEILEKNAFHYLEKERCFFNLNIDLHPMTFGKYAPYRVGKIVMFINYVHELQHLVRLSVSGKEIKL